MTAASPGTPRPGIGRGPALASTEAGGPSTLVGVAAGLAGSSLVA
ncbi:MAG TPA: hypothetical protein VH589_30345 [Trebonia sp.]